MDKKTLKEKIRAIERSGEVAAPNTWISSYVVTKKNGKSYRYYRLVTSLRDGNGKLKPKMLKYLGNEQSSLYLKTLKAIQRRNQIQALSKKLNQLVEKSSCPKTYTNLLVQLQEQIQKLTDRVENLEQERGRMLKNESRKRGEDGFYETILPVFCRNRDFKG